jgi:sulfur-carrier protein
MGARDAFQHPALAEGALAMKAIYFAWVRERVGLSEEELTPPAEVVTVGDLMRWLERRGDGYAAAFASSGPVRAALDRLHVRPDAVIAGAREIAFFPPMTGG